MSMKNRNEYGIGQTRSSSLDERRSCKSNGAGDPGRWMVVEYQRCRKMKVVGYFVAIIIYIAVLSYLLLGALDFHLGVRIGSLRPRRILLVGPRICFS
jgi:hypothetical protein